MLKGENFHFFVIVETIGTLTDLERLNLKHTCDTYLSWKKHLYRKLIYFNKRGFTLNIYLFILKMDFTFYNIR